MRSHRGLWLLAAVLTALAVSACGSSNSSQTSTASSGSSTASSSSPPSAASSTASTGDSSSTTAGGGALVDSAAMRSELEQEITSTAGVKVAEAKKIVDCIIAKLSAAGIKTQVDAASHESQLSNFSASCAEKVVNGGG